MQAGDIIFVRGKSPLSKLIRLFDKGEFSHVAIALSETHVLEAQYFTKSRITPFYFEDFEVIPLNLSEELQIETMKIAISLTGKWYDYLQIIGYVLDKDVNHPQYLICSEMVAVLLYELDITNDFETIRNYTPNELYEYLKER